MNNWTSLFKRHHIKDETKLVFMMEQVEQLNENISWLEEQYDRLLESARPFSKMGSIIKKEIEMLWVGTKMNKFLYQESIGKLQDNLRRYISKMQQKGKTPNAFYVEKQNESIRNIIDYVQRLETLNSLYRMELRRARLQIDGMEIETDIHIFEKRPIEDDVLDLIIEEFPKQEKLIRSVNQQIETLQQDRKTKTTLIANELHKINTQ